LQDVASYFSVPFKIRKLKYSVLIFLKSKNLDVWNEELTTIEHLSLTFRAIGYKAFAVDQFGTFVTRFSSLNLPHKSEAVNFQFSGWLVEPLNPIAYSYGHSGIHIAG
jgi:hypothetical protein